MHLQLGDTTAWPGLKALAAHSGGPLPPEAEEPRPRHQQGPGDWGRGSVREGFQEERGSLKGRRLSGMKGGEHGALCGKDELGKGGWNLGLCSALKLPASLPGPQLCGAKGGPHGGDRGGDEHGEGVPSGRPSGKAGAARAVSASRFPGLARPLPVALGTAGQTHLSSWQALMLAHRLGSLTAPDSRKAFSYLGSGVRRGLGDSPWLLRPRVRPPGFSLLVVRNLEFRGNGMNGSPSGTTSVHTLATPATTSRPRIRPHLCRKSPSARAQIPNVVASSSAEMAPAAFTCSATSCQ